MSFLQILMEESVITFPLFFFFFWCNQRLLIVLTETTIDVIAISIPSAMTIWFKNTN